MLLKPTEGQVCPAIIIAVCPLSMPVYMSCSNLINLINLFPTNACLCIPSMTHKQGTVHADWSALKENFATTSLFLRFLHCLSSL